MIKPWVAKCITMPSRRMTHKQAKFHEYIPKVSSRDRKNYLIVSSRVESSEYTVAALASKTPGHTFF
jgi:hypothetical protein